MNLSQLISGERTFEMSMAGQGSFTLNEFKIESKHSFLEFIAGGCNIDLSIAIDFTGSNGNP